MRLIIKNKDTTYDTDCDYKSIDKILADIALGLVEFGYDYESVLTRMNQVSAKLLARTNKEK